MKTKSWLLALVAAVLLSAAPALADGDMYVVVGGGGGVGTKISALPYTISQPGFYYVTGNLSCPSGGNGITVNADDVTIDLMGFCLSSYGSSYGIYMEGRKNVEIRNGTLRNWDRGIYTQDPTFGSPAYHRIINVRVHGHWPMEGIYLSGSCHLVKGCTISGGSVGIFALSSTITGNQVFNCQNGIQDSSYEKGGTTSNNLVFDCSAYGIDSNGTISSNVVRNCATGIICRDHGSIIGNTVICNLGQIGIDFGGAYHLVDQNTVAGSGTHCTLVGSNITWGKNSGISQPPQ